MPRYKEALVLSHNPLTLVLAQVKIAPILAIEKYIPELQEKLRKNGFPKTRIAKTQELEFGPQVNVRETTRWIFTDKDDVLAISISTDSIFLESARYEKFELFSEQLAAGLKMFSEATQASLSERLGLRYVNLIQPSEGEQLKDYLMSGLQGIPSEAVEGVAFRNRFESVGKTPIGRLVIRLTQHKNGSKLPRDLTNDGLKTKEIQRPKEPYAFLDIDHFVVEQNEFDSRKLIERMWDIHKYTDLAFKAAVTPHALAKWK